MAGHHDPLLVAASVILAVFASYVALQLAGRVALSVGRPRVGWLLGGSMAMGLGIWSMHFTAMLAYRLPVPIQYDVPLWLLSILIAVAASLLALLFVSRETVAWPGLLVSGGAMGAAIAGMHYLGMAAVRVPGRLQYDPTLVVASLAIAVGAALAALWLLVYFRDRRGRSASWGKAGSAVVMGLAIVGLHYTAMAGVRFVPGERIPVSSWLPLLSTDGLELAVVMGALVVLALAAVATLLDRRMQTATEAAETVRHRAATALEASTDGIAILDEDGTITRLNSAYAAIYGYDEPDTMVGRTWWTLFEDDESRRFEDEVSPTLAHEGRWRGEALGRKRDGALFPKEVSLAAMEGGGHVCVVRDVSDRKAAERERRTMQARLAQAERMESLGRLAGGIAHDFNNILAVFKMHLAILEEDLASTEAAHGDLRELSRAADRATRLVQQILAFSSQQVLTPRVIDLNDSIRELMPMIRRLAGEAIHVEFSGEPGLGRTYADLGQFEQVVVNLVVNARDAMPDGGTLRIRTDNVGLPPAEVRDVPGTPEVSGDYVRLQVEDTGVGMEPDLVGRVFEPFFTTKPVGKGTGLGLATVHGIVRQSGGLIGVESRPGEGSRFSIYLVRVAADGATAPDVLAAPASDPIDLQWVSGSHASDSGN